MRVCVVCVCYVCVCVCSVCAGVCACARVCVCVCVSLFNLPAQGYVVYRLSCAWQYFSTATNKLE